MVWRPPRLWLLLLAVASARPRRLGLSLDPCALLDFMVVWCCCWIVQWLVWWCGDPTRLLLLPCRIHHGVLAILHGALLALSFFLAGTLNGGKCPDKPILYSQHHHLNYTSVAGPTLTIATRTSEGPRRRRRIREAAAGHRQGQARRCKGNVRVQEDEEEANYNLEKELTVLWEKMRCRDVSKENRSKLVTEAVRKMDGKYMEIAGNHVTARVLQVFSIREADTNDLK